MITHRGEETTEPRATPDDLVAALDSANLRLRALFEDNPHPMWVYDLASLRFLEVNHAAVEKYGYSRDEFLEMNIAQIRPAEEVPRLRRNLAGNRPPLQVSTAWRHLLKDGTVIDVDITSHIFDHEGRQAVLVVAQDITARKRAELAERERDIAEAASQAKSEYLSRMNHELRTPLSAIMGFADLLALKDPRPDQDANIAAIHKAADHVLTLVNDALDIARIEAGVERVSMQPVDLRDVAGEGAALITPLVQARRMTLRIETSAADAGAVVADRPRMIQVLLNLLGNAVKYSAEGGAITVAVGGSPDRPAMRRLSVTDTGPGLSATQQERAFDPFERLGAERGYTQGSGLGLTLCRTIIETMGGMIGVESRPGAGSTFWVDLPGVGTHALPTTGRLDR